MMDRYFRGASGRIRSAVSDAEKVQVPLSRHLLRKTLNSGPYLNHPTG